MAKRCIFILGGARSGKSRFAHELADKLGKKVLYVATGEALDEEMSERIARHKKSRPKSWRTLEIPTNVGKGLIAGIGDAEVVVIDCLTLLVSNCVGDEADCVRAEQEMIAEIDGLIASMDKLSATLIIVSNEVGLGLVPDNPMGRYYRDILGQANQLVAQHATDVCLMVAGIPLWLKGTQFLPL